MSVLSDIFIVPIYKDMGDLHIDHFNKTSRDCYDESTWTIVDSRSTADIRISCGGIHKMCILFQQ